MGKKWQNREGSAGGRRVAILNGGQEGLPEKVAFEQRPEEGRRRKKMVPGEMFQRVRAVLAKSQQEALAVGLVGASSLTPKVCGSILRAHLSRFWVRPLLGRV